MQVIERKAFGKRNEMRKKRLSRQTALRLCCGEAVSPIIDIIRTKEHLLNAAPVYRAYRLASKYKL